MAKIVPSDTAPSEQVHYSFATVEFDLGGSGKGSKKFYSTDDRALLSEAEVHPWLSVEYDADDAYVSVNHSNSVKPEDDALSAVGPGAEVPFDHAEIDKVENAKWGASDDAPVAIEAGLDQTEVVETAGVAETVAAANANDDNKDNS